MDFCEAFLHTDELFFVSKDGERHYHVRIGVPFEAALPMQTKREFPIVYMLDGDEVFAELASYTAKQMPDAFVVGIGYDQEKTDWIEARVFDYTPAIEGVYDLRDPRSPLRRAGGANGFLDLLEYEVMPKVAQMYPVSFDKQVFYGHSYGGLCVLHALFTRTHLFKHWIAVSPSLWWHEGHMERQAQAFIAQMAGGLKSSATLAVMAGSQEVLRQQQSDENGVLTLSRSEQLALDLARVSGLDVSFTLLEGAGHRQAFEDSLKVVLGNLAFLNT